jgi:hypothetical protein
MSDLLVFVIAPLLLFVPVVLVKAYILQRSGQNVIFLSRIRAIGGRIRDSVVIGSVVDIETGEEPK